MQTILSQCAIHQGITLHNYKIDTNDKKNLPKIQSISNLLLDQAKLLEGIPLDDSKMFCDKLNDLILQSIN